MARTAAESVALSDDDISELVEDAVSDIPGSGSATDEDEGSDELTISEVDTSDLDEPEETEEGEQEEEEAETEAPPAGAKPGQPPAAAAAASAEKPFQFKASGAVHTFPGVTESAAGELKVTKEAAAQIRQVLASHVELQKTSKEGRRALQRQIESLKKDRNDKDIEADLVIGLFQNIRNMTPEQRWAWANELEEKAPKLEVEIEKQKLQRDREALERERKGPELSEEEQQEVFADSVRSEVQTTFNRLLALPESKLLTEADRNALWQKWTQRGHRLVTREGDQTMFDDAEIVEDFVDRLNLRREQAKLAKAASRNAAMNADQRGSRIPPTIKGGKSPASAEGKKKDFRGKRKAFAKEFMEGKLDSE